MLVSGYSPPQPTCSAKVDVGFILDSSGSLRNDYQREKDFLTTLAATFGVTQDNARASVVTFSYFADLSIKFNDHSDIISFAGAVDAIPLMGSTTRIDRALRETQNQMFSLKNGARLGVTKILILLTDGSQTKDAGAEDPAAIADEIRRSGIAVILVGIGAGVNQVELDKIAGGPENAFSAASFDELVGGTFIQEFSEKACKEGSLFFTGSCFRF